MPRTFEELPLEQWEDFDAAALFNEAPRLHAKKVTKIDTPENVKFESGLDFGDESPSAEDSSEEPDFDNATFTDSKSRSGHENDLLEVEGLDAPSSSDQREVNADAEEDKRTKSEEGAEKPIQKESEGIEEVAEATSKTSEDVHGGDEATKDIENSPNAADNGQNPDNHGAESGEGGDSGDGEGQGDKGSASTDEEGFFETEEWEKAADASTVPDRLQNLFQQAMKQKPETANSGGSSVDYSATPLNLADQQAIFFKTRELIKKLLSLEDMAARKEGSAIWDAEQIVKRVVKYQYHRVSSAKFDRPKENKLIFFVDVSGSVSSLAELFMALMGGAAGLTGVHIVVGSEAHAEREIVVDRPFKSVEAAVAFFRAELSQHSRTRRGAVSASKEGWRRPYEQEFEPGIFAYLEENNLLSADTTCVFFGDMQDVHFNTKKLKRLAKSVNCLWLFTDEPGHNTHTGDLPRAIEAKLPIVYNVRTAKAFSWAVRRLQTIRSGMQLVPPKG